MTGDVVVRACGLVKTYGDRTAVGGIDFEIGRGSAFGFLGPNGAGKSTTMRMIGCVAEPSAGTLSVVGLDPRRQGATIRGRLGICPQDNTLDPDLTALENLTVYARYFRIPRRVARERSRDLLEMFQLTDRAGDKVDALSGGMKRRLTIARALVNRPEILLLDEPTTGLDPQSRHQVWELLFRIRQRGVTLLLTTHYMDEAEQLCDQLAVMDAGRIVADGPPRALIERFCTRDVVEVRVGTDPPESLVGKLEGVCERLEVLPDRILLYAADGDAVLAALHDRGVRPAGALVRRGSLEDVFLRLTGRALVD